MMPAVSEMASSSQISIHANTHTRADSGALPAEEVGWDLETVGLP